MMFHGWEYDFTSLPHWDIRNEYHFAYDSLYENPSSDTAVLLYSIVECRMLCYAGFLAIVRNKKKPELMLRVEEITFWDSRVVFSADGALVFAKPYLWISAGRRLSVWLVFIFDVSTERFACFRILANDIDFTVKERERNVFIIVADEQHMKQDASGLPGKLNGTKIELDALEWMPWSEINSFCVRLMKEAIEARYGFFERIYRRLAERIRALICKTSVKT